MILKQLLELIRSDGELNKLQLYPNEAPIEECIIYNFTPVTNNKILRQDSFKVRVKAFDYVKGIEIAERLKDVLITLADRKLTDDILTCVQDGGGEMYNDETKLHTITILFNLKSKVRR